MVHMDKILQWCAVQRQSFLVMIESPAEKFFDIIGDMQLYLFRWDGQPWVYLLKNKGEFDLKLAPKFFIDLRHVMLGISYLPWWLQLIRLLLTLETWLSEPFLPGMQINPEHWDLIISNNQQFLSNIPEHSTMHLILVVLRLKCFEGRSDGLHFINRLFENWSNQRLLLQRNKCLIACLIEGDRFLKECLYLSWYFSLRDRFEHLDILMKNIREIT